MGKVVLLVFVSGLSAKVHDWIDFVWSGLILSKATPSPKSVSILFLFMFATDEPKQHPSIRFPVFKNKMAPDDEVFKLNGPNAPKLETLLTHSGNDGSASRMKSSIV